MRNRFLLLLGLAGLLCVDVRIDQSDYLNCLNEMFRAAAKHSSVVESPGFATSSPPATGLYDQAAVRETLGTSFGHSVVPQRPPPMQAPHLLR
jgi:hypothetical protein